MSRRLAAFAAIVGALALPAIAAAAPTREEYIAQADPICHTTNDAVARAARGLQADKKNGRFKAAARKLRNEGAAQTQGIDQLEILEAPAADSQLIGTWLGMLRAQEPVIKQLAKDYAHGNIKTSAYRQLAKLIPRTEALVTGFGFQYCQDM